MTGPLTWQNPAPIPLQDSHIILALVITAGREVALWATIIEANNPGHRAADFALQTCFYSSPLQGKTVGFVNAVSNTIPRRDLEEDLRCIWRSAESRVTGVMPLRFLRQKGQLNSQFKHSLIGKLPEHFRGMNSNVWGLPAFRRSPHLLTSVSVNFA